MKIKTKFIDTDKVESLNIYDISNFKRTFYDVYSISIMRSIMNQLLEKLYFKGNILDIGGGHNSNYKNILKYDSYKSINIDSKINPDFLIKVGERFPIEDDTFDQCLLFNVLEHIYDWEELFTEIIRVLKLDGCIHIIIPFIYPIHGAPNDYKRVTSEYLKKFLKDKNFKKIRIYPFSYGPFTNSQLIGYRHKLINGPMAQLSVLIDKLFQIYFRNKYIRYNDSSPLFYYAKASL